MSHITKALSLLATESWNAEDPATTDHWRDLALKARQELDELRDHSYAYKRVCEVLGCAEGADGRIGTHYADVETVCRALREMLAEAERLTNNEYERQMETGE